MLAHALLPELRSRGHEVTGLSRSALDVTDREAVFSVLRSVRPDAVVQCAAYTAVDDAEANEAEAYKVNADGTRNVAESCQNISALFVFPSTDYVFSGKDLRPYRPDDAPAPVNAYGRSKLEGERAARAAARSLIVRTSWLYGAGGKNFVDTILDRGRTRETVDVVADQVGKPTWAGSLSAVIAELLQLGAAGTFHACDGGEPVSWHGFANEIFSQMSLRASLRAVSTGEFPRLAPRPGFSVLDCTGTEAALGRPLPNWKESLRRYLSGS